MRVAKNAAAHGTTQIAAVLAVAGLLVRPRREVGHVSLAWGVAFAAFFVVAGNGNERHPWYQLPVVPVVAALAGAALDVVARELETRIGRWSAAIACVAVFAAFAWPAYRESARWQRPWNLPALHAGQAIDRALPADALIAVVDGGDPTTIYYAHRRGWHLPVDFGHEPNDVAQLDRELADLRQQGLGWIVVLRHTPDWAERFPELRPWLETVAVKTDETREFAIYRVR